MPETPEIIVQELISKHCQAQMATVFIRIAGERSAEQPESRSAS
jgi:hypothetical protein